MTPLMFIQDGGFTIGGGDIPWAIILGPYGLTVYVIIDNIRLRKQNDELRKTSDEMAKTALAALKKAVEG